MYGGPLHNAVFIKRILSYLPALDRNVYGTIDRLEGMLRTAYEELKSEETPQSAVSPLDTAKDIPGHSIIPVSDASKLDLYPFYFVPSALAKVLRISAPPEAAIKGALRRAGYWVTRTHAKPNSIKTDAPWSFLWQVMRAWAKQKCPPKEGAVKEGMPGWRISQQVDEDGDTSKIIFDQHLGKDRAEKRLVRYQLNPRPNWGPMNKASGS